MSNWTWGADELISAAAATLAALSLIAAVRCFRRHMWGGGATLAVLTCLMALICWVFGFMRLRLM